MPPHVNSEKTLKSKNESSTSLSALTQERATESNAIQIPQISLPKGGGAIKGIEEKFQINSNNGAASFSLPFPFSPNRNGLDELNRDEDRASLHAIDVKVKDALRVLL